MDKNTFPVKGFWKAPTIDLVVKESKITPGHFEVRGMNEPWYFGSNYANVKDHLQSLNAQRMTEEEARTALVAQLEALARFTKDPDQLAEDSMAWFANQLINLWEDLA